MNGAGSDRRVAVAAWVAAAAVFVMALLYAFGPQLGTDVPRTAVGLGDLLAALLCTVLCYILWRNFDRSELLRQVWLNLGIGLAMWTLAEFIYGLYGLILQRDPPNPSLADAVWLPAFIPIFAAFWLRYRSLRVSLSRRQIAALLVGFAILAGLSLAFVLIPSLSLHRAGEEAGDLTLGVIYGLGDLLLAMVVGLTIVSLLGGQLSRSWLIVALGFLAIAVGDSLYYSGVATGWYSDQAPANLPSAISDIAYWAGYVIIALGLFDQAVLQRAL